MDANNVNQKDLKPWLASLIIFMGAFTILVATFIDLDGLDLSRGLIIAGLLFVVGILLWFFFRILNSGLKVQFAIVIALYILSAVFFLWMGTWLGPKSSAGYPKSVTSYDFESKADREGWGEGVQLSDEQAFDGEKALKAVLPVLPNEKTTFYLHWQHEFEADVVVGQIYWPFQVDANLEWAQVCVPFEEWSCTFISKEQGWNTFVLDLSEMKTVDGQSLSENVKLPGIVFQGVLQTTDPNRKSLFIYLDAMQIYTDGQKY